MRTKDEKNYKGSRMHISPRRPRTANIPSSSGLVAASLALVLFGCGAAADAASQPAQAPLGGAAGYGNPPSGEIPILFNDHTVYAKPDLLEKGRVLAAFVKGGQIYVPLRSMFEQMGASVSASADGKTLSATKSGASVSVTVGKPEVLLNGESRPLDVPPMLYKGVVLVPVRVISEALGAYVQWVPSQRVVVVRYVPIAPAPPVASPKPVATAAPTMTPAIPAPVPTAAPTRVPYHAFIQGAFAAPKTYNEFSAGQWCRQSYVLSGAYAFANSPFAVKADFRQDVYVTSDNLTSTLDNHYTRFATIDGGTALTPVFLAKQSTLDARLEYQIIAPRINLGVGYFRTANNYGYPDLHALGVGVEKLPDLRPGLSFFGSGFYYPNAREQYTVTGVTSPNAGTTYEQKYDVFRYDVGLALVFAHFPVYIDGGFSGDHYTARTNAPIGQTHDGPYIGLGVKL